MKSLQALFVPVALLLACPTRLYADQASAQYEIAEAIAQMSEAIDLGELADSGIASTTAYKLDVIGWRAAVTLNQYQTWDYNNSFSAAEANLSNATSKKTEGDDRFQSGDEWLDEAITAYLAADWTAAEGCAVVAQYDYGQALARYQESLLASEAAWEFLQACEAIVHPNP